ncbi:hypothetical protein OG894_09920 [Streptomyces sp. NBC_01724]|uniref:hypothetical protein n=1 Tax=Streptomyces sp. NBC_01724 TaxID=2975922 RepID=UPI002E31205A|nr:hypothetical protein [Streptomyces sp. NBC_01724]
MNGYEHYQRAEELLTAATKTQRNPAGISVCYVSPEEQERLTRLAAIHAQLALSAATADATRFQRDLYEGNGEPAPQAAARKRNAAAKSAAIADDFIGGAA